MKKNTMNTVHPDIFEEHTDEYEELEKSLFLENIQNKTVAIPSLRKDINTIKYSVFMKFVTGFNKIPKFIAMLENERYATIANKIGMDEKHFYLIVSDGDDKIPFAFDYSKVNDSESKETVKYAASCKNIETCLEYVESICRYTGYKVNFSDEFIEKVQNKFGPDFSKPFGTFLSVRLPKPTL